MKFNGNNYILIIEPGKVREGKDGDLWCDRGDGKTLNIAKGMEFIVPEGKVAYPGGLRYSTFHGMYGCDTPLPPGTYRITAFMAGDPHAPATGKLETC